MESSSSNFIDFYIVNGIVKDTFIMYCFDKSVKKADRYLIFYSCELIMIMTRLRETYNGFGTKIDFIPKSSEEMDKILKEMGKL